MGWLPRALVAVGLTAAAATFPSPNATAAPSPCVTPPPSMTSWWPADGDALDIQGGHNGVLRGDTAFAAGMVDQAFSFDGSGDFVRAPDSRAWTLGDHAFTIDLWVRIDDLAAGGRQSFVSHDEGPGELRKWIFWFDVQGHGEPSGNALRFHINGPKQGPLDPVFAPWTPVDGRWYHVAVTRTRNAPDHPSVWRLFIDGKRVARRVDRHTIHDAVAPLRIGYSEVDFFLHGATDEVEIFHRALTGSEISTIYASGSAGKCKPA
jgi:hypothetical protein